MSTADSMATVISTLDWDSDPGPAPLAAHEDEQLRSRLGDGPTRWVAGAVEQSLAALHEQIHDSLAPSPSRDRSCSSSCAASGAGPGSLSQSSVEITVAIESVVDTRSA